MKNLIFIFLLFSPAFLNAQDTLKISKPKLFDIALHGVSQIMDSKTFNFNELVSMAKNTALKNESAGYTEKENEYATPDEGYDVGLSCSFKLASEKKIVRRIRPRLGIYYSNRTYRNEKFSFKNTTLIDTLYYSNPNIAPLLIDSASKGTLNSQFFTQQLSLELGVNMDVFTFSNFILYTGIIYAQGFGLNNKFTLTKREDFSVKAYPGEAQGKSGVLKDYTLSEKIPACFTSRVVIPFGMQHRFSARRKISPGVFVEFRPGYEYCQSKGAGLSRFFFSISGGIRVSLQKHK